MVDFAATLPSASPGWRVGSLRPGDHSFPLCVSPFGLTSAGSSLHNRSMTRLGKFLFAAIRCCTDIVDH